MKNNKRFGNQAMMIAPPVFAAKNTTISPKQQVSVERLTLTTRQAAQALSIHPRSLRRAEIRGLVRSVNIFRTRLWPVSELTQLIEKGLQ